MPVRPCYGSRAEARFRIITDRYALPKGADLNACDPKDQTWCGGTWNTIRENLDYVQDQGFTASACLGLSFPHSATDMHDHFP